MDSLLKNIDLSKYYYFLDKELVYGDIIYVNDTYIIDNIDFNFKLF